MHVYLPHVYIQKKIIISLSVSSRTVGILKRYKVKVKVMLKNCKQMPTALKEKIQMKQV